MRSIFVVAGMVSIMLTGCMPHFLGSRQEDPEVKTAVSEPLSEVGQFIAENAAGTHSTIEDESFGGQVEVSVEGEFRAASGRDCKRAVVSRPPQETEIVVICRNGEEWEMMPRVWGRGLD